MRRTKKDDGLRPIVSRRSGAQWLRTRRARLRTVDFAITSPQIWTAAYRDHLDAYCADLRGALDAGNAAVLDAMINADRDEDLRRLEQEFELYREVLALQAERARTKASADDANADDLGERVRQAQGQLNAVDSVLATRRELTLFDITEPERAPSS